MEIEQDFLNIIEEGRSDGNLYFLPNYQLDRKVYLGVNKILECLGGKWNRKLKAHIFETNISDAIDDVLLTGEVIDSKKEFQFFETPQKVMDQLVELAEIQKGNKCLEPSAGRGNIAEALRKIVGNDMVYCVELNPSNAKVLIEKKFQVYEGDFLQYNTRYAYDRIVMNPPFTRQQDIDHVQKALLHLKKDGILVSVMSIGATFRQNKKTVLFWEKVKEHEFNITDLPSEAFKLSGTMVNTIILKVNYYENTYNRRSGIYRIPSCC